MRAATYTRISSELQSDGHSLDAQATACEHLCAERGWQVVARYSDVASGRTTNRPQFKAMLADAERGMFDVIVVHKLDRFSRSTVDTLRMLSHLDTKKVSFIAATEQFDFTTPIGKASLTMLAAVSQYFIDNLATEVAKGKRARATKGLWNSMLPFGYAVAYMKDGGDGKPQPDPTSAPAVRMAFEQYALGIYSDLDIAKMLNEKGFRPQGRGKRGLQLWSKDSVRFMLMNSFYAGDIRYHDESMQGKHEPLITHELFEQCQQVRVARRPRYGCTATSGSKIYPLSGLARCARCHTRMRATSSKRGQFYRYYRDPSHDKNLGCDQRFVSAQAAEDALGEFLSGLTLPDDWRDNVLAMVSNRMGKGDYESEMRKLKEQRRRLQQLFLYGDITQQN